MLKASIQDRIALAMHGGVAPSVPTGGARMAGPADPNGGSLAELAAPALLSLVMLVFWATLEPFHDRSGAAMLGTQGAGNLINQLAFPLLAAIVVAYVARTRPGYYRSLMAPVYIVFVLWLLVVALRSGEIGTALRRVSFELFCVATAASVLALPRTQREFAAIIGSVALIVLGLSYFGVLALPGLSIHQATDAIERELAGDWRGIYPHKNLAGAVMALFVFVGLFVAEAWNRVAGWTIVVAAAVFVWFTHSKTTIALIPFVLLATWGMERSTRGWQRALIVVGVVAFMNTFTVGASWPGPIHTVIAKVMKDPSYTGRTELWRFSAANIAKKPIFGFGMGGFWRTSEIMYNDKTEVDPENADQWVTELGTDSHNSYLETALQIGVPGLVLLLLWVIVLPLLAYPHAAAPPENKLMVRFFTRVWLQVLYMTALETVFLTRNNPVWFTALIAIFGLHLLTRRRVAA